MHEIRTTLERIERRVPMPEPAMERLLRRRERKERNERIAAAVVGLGVAAAGLAGVMVTLQVVEGTRPATEGGGASATEGGGFVLPTVAIWAAIVVLGLTVLAAVRLRYRFADKDADVEHEGRGPGEAAASARRSAADPGSAPWKGGSEMDSRSKTEVVGLPHAEMPEIRFGDGKLRRTNRWLIGAVGVLAVVVVALGVTLIVQVGSNEAARPPTTPVQLEPEGLADQAVASTVEDWFTALNAGDPMGALYTKDAVLELHDLTPPQVFQGREAIALHFEQLTGAVVPFHAQPASDVLQIGNFAVVGNSYAGGGGFSVFQLDEELKIAHHWVMGT